MQHNGKKQFWLFCFLFVVIAYLPVVSFQFAIKNDFFTAYFPLKKFLSTSLEAGSFPLWNPFLNYGFPVYGDMSEAWWNPLTWLIAAGPGYNVWTFTLELIIYLFIAFAGMYHLTGRWVRQVEWRMMAAAAYAASGFMVGHLQHFNWISAAGLLPFCMHYLISYTVEGKKNQFLMAAFFLGFFATAAHPGLIIGAILYGFFWLLLSAGEKQIAAKRVGKLMILTLITCAGMIYAYAEVLPYTNRSAALQVVSSSEGSTTLSSWISFILPLATTRGDFFTNDIALRNCYFGLPGLVACISYFFTRGSNPTVRFHLVLGAVFLVLSSNFFLPVFQKIPLLKFIRLNGELRIFSLLSFILAAAIQWQDVWNADHHKRIIQVLRVMKILLFIFFAGAALYAVPGWSGIWKQLPNIKQALETITFYDAVFLQSLILLILVHLLIRSVQRRNKRSLMFLVMADVALASLMQLPFTGVGQRSVAEMHQIFGQAPSGLKMPSLAAEDSVVATYPDVKALAGNWALVSQEIAQDDLIPYPLIFQTTSHFMDSPLRDSFYRKPPFLLISGNKMVPIAPVRYRYDFFRFEINQAGATALVIKQNNYPFWHASLNGIPVSIEDTAHAFMKASLKDGKNELEFHFRHPVIKILLAFQFILMTSMVIMAYIYRKDPIA